MRIIYLHQYFHTPAVAGSIRSYEMARRFVAWGHEVHLITADREARGGTYRSDEAGIQVHWLGVPYSNMLGTYGRIRAFFEFAWRAAHKAAELEGDLIFATSTPLTVALPAVYAARRKGVPMVFEVRDLWPELPVAMGTLKGYPLIAAAQWLERFAYRNAAHVIALSPGMKAGVARAGYPASRVHVIPNSADLDLFGVPASAGAEFRAAHPWLGERPLVLYAGTLGAINGVGYLARLAAALKAHAPEVCFLVIGHGPDEEKIRALARELEVLGENFFMIPKVPKAAMPAVLSATTVATSLFIDLEEMWVNSANKFFDALASGTPVAINYGGWQAELLREHGAGLVLDPHDVAGSAQRLLEKLRDEAWLRRAGEASRHLAETRFSRDDLAKQLEGVLLRALETSR